ncbi:hypothetical protein RhiirC2_791313 [Rhizophagus irregularis]|uniref:HAT C-terminal dimerisation domain-containing protein n=1 Tax=Rhizophagus irregularis TaxID=588596 RepID=A0A2N1MJF1_9GLOM|nr:hypothetical protein RhiirC2_791313 [Rhizophagus irregularis]
MPLILTYFLHPGYRSAGLKLGMWMKISNYAQSIWKNMGYSVEDQEILVAQMLNFKEKQDMPPFVKNLALKMFAVIPHSASCERMFSALENDQTDSEIQNLVNESFYFEDSDDNYDDDNNEDESGYKEIIEDQIPNHEVYVLIKDYFDSAILENDMFEEEEEDLYVLDIGLQNLGSSLMEVPNDPDSEERNGEIILPKIL